MGWRGDIGKIREIISGESSEGWRGDIYAIARAEGYNPTSWREAIRMLAQGKGVTESSWRANICGIAERLTGIVPISWRGAVSYIRKYYEDKPIEPPKRYGIRVADDESNPLTERLYDAAGMVANVGMSLTDNPRNDFDFVYPFSEIIEIVINGRTMIQIPKFYVRREYYEEDGYMFREWAICKEKYDDSYVPHEMFLKGNAAYTGTNPESDYNDYVWVAKYETSSDNASVSDATVQVSQTRAMFRTNAKAIGDGWAVMDIATWSGLWTLFHIVFANRNSQAIMKGNYSGAVKATGLTNGKAASCVQISNTAMSFYGIENLYGNVYKWIDGININSGQAYVATKISDFADATATNYRQVGYTNAAANGYIVTLGYDTNNKFAEFPITVGGSAITYYCDSYSQSTAWRGLGVGGFWVDSTEYGVSAWNATVSALGIYNSFGSRLTYRPYEGQIFDTQFFLNVPPRQPNTKYIITSTGVIESDKIIME